jgi:hypothetical protein
MICDARFLRLLLLVDADVTAGEGAAGGITVAQPNRKSVRASGAAVIRHSDAEPDSAPVARIGPAAKVSTVSVDGEVANFALRNRDTSGGITKGQGAARAVTRLGREKVEGGLIALAIDRAAAIDPRYEPGIV